MHIMAAFCFETLFAKLQNLLPPKYPSSLPDAAYPLFVTWMKQDDLRGCIGTFDSSQNLKSLLSKYALISAMEDDRFGPIKLSEVPQLSIGLSLLINFTEIDDPLDWEVGKHGVEIELSYKGQHYSATFLPEVAA